MTLQRNGWVIMVMALGMMAAGPASALARTGTAGQHDATVVLHVVNSAQLPRGVLDQARMRVETVYRIIGVRIVWIETGATIGVRQDGQVHFAVLLLSCEMAENKIAAEGIGPNVLGQAHLASGRAHIFSDRIATMPGVPTLFAIRLGSVIAHEMGHLLLQANSHSRSGIMRESMNGHAIHIPSFDNTQADSIRRRLIDLTDGIAR